MDSRALLFVRLLLLWLILAAELCGQAPWRMRTLAGGSEAGDGGRALDASLRFVQGIAVGGRGEIYLADADDHRLRRIGADGRIETIAGDGLPGLAGDGEASRRARLHTPYGVSVGPGGDVYVADLGNARVRRIAPDGRIETLVPGFRFNAPRNVLAAPDGRVFVSDFGAGRVYAISGLGVEELATPPGGLAAPTGLALDGAGNLYIADSGQARVLRYSRQRVYTVYAQGLERPTGLAWHPEGYLLIADSRGDFHWKVSEGGMPSPVFPGGRDVAVDAQGRTIMAGGTWVRRLDRQGLLEIVIDNRFQSFRGDGGPATEARLSRPTGMALDSKRNVYFSDTRNHRIRRITPDGRIDTVAGTGEAGFRGDGGAAKTAQLHSPTYLAVDAFDNVYVSDTGNHRVRVLSAGGAIQTAAGTGRDEFSNDGLLASQASLSSPAGLALDAEGNLYVAERGLHRVRRFRPGGRISTVAGNGLRGNAPEASDALLGSLNEAAGLAIDAAGNLYLADRGNGMVRQLVKATGRWRNLAVGLKGPEAIAWAAPGLLYWSETGAHVVRQLDTRNDALATVAGRSGENGFNAESGDATALTLNEAAGLALTPEGSLLIADTLNDRLRLAEAPASSGGEQSAERTRVVHGATFLAGALAPGMLATIFSVELNEALTPEVLCDGFPAKISFASRRQINFQVPEAVAGRAFIELELRQGGLLLYRASFPLAGAAPAFFETGGGQAVAVDAAGRLNGEANPARPSDILVLYGTGAGLMTERSGFAVPFLPVAVELNGVAAELLFAGAAPGFPGLVQVNLRVPANLRAAGRVAVTWRVGAFRNPATQSLFVF